MTAFLRLRFRQLGNSWVKGEKGKFFLFFLLGLFFVVVLSYFSMRIFGYLSGLEEFPSYFRLFLSEKLLAMVFMTLFVMLIFSAMLSSLNILFLSRDLPLLFASPLKVGSIFFWKSAEVFANSSAMVIFFSLPVLAAFCYYFAPTFTAVLQVAWVYALLIVTGFAAGLILGIIIPAFFSVRRLQPILSVFSIILISLLVVFLRLLRPERFLNPDEIDNLFRYMSSLDLRVFSYFPFAWASQAIADVALDQNADYWKLCLLFAGTLALLAGAVWLLQKKMYLRLIDKLASSGRGNAKSSWRLGGLAGDYSPLWKKEIKTFLRTPAQWSQLLIIGALMAVTVLNLKMIPVPHPAIRNVIAYFNLALALFIVAGLNSRFTFPAIPIEGGGLIHVVSSPFRRDTFYVFKFLFYWLPLLVIGMTLFIVGDMTLKIDPFFRLAAFLFLPLAVTSLTSLALLFGVNVPEIAPLSPQHLVVSRRGIAYMLWSMIVIVASLVFFARPLFLYYYHQALRRPLPWVEIVLWLSVFVLAHLLLTLVAYRRGKTVWQKREF